MKLKYIFLTLVGVAAFAVSAHADTVDFTVTSPTFGNTWTFSLPQSPTPDIVLGPPLFPLLSQFQFLAVPVSMSGAAPVPTLMSFFDSNGLTFACGDSTGGALAHVTSCTWHAETPPTAIVQTSIYTGSLSHPTFIPGNYTATLSESASDGEAWNFTALSQLSITKATSVPEPSSLALLGLGLAFFLPLKKYGNRLSSGSETLSQEGH